MVSPLPAGSSTSLREKEGFQGLNPRVPQGRRKTFSGCCDCCLFPGQRGFCLFGRCGWCFLVVVMLDFGLLVVCCAFASDFLLQPTASPNNEQKHHTSRMREVEGLLAQFITPSSCSPSPPRRTSRERTSLKILGSMKHTTQYTAHVQNTPPMIVAAIVKAVMVSNITTVTFAVTNTINIFCS